MARGANSGRMWKAAAVPLLLSLAVHGLLLLVLWVCPTRARGPALSIESTRIALDACLLDVGMAPKDEHDLPPEVRGPDVSTAFIPRLEEPVAFAPAEAGSPAGPVLLSGGPPAPAAPHPGEGGAGSLFPREATAGSVVYVLDRSVSMGEDDLLGLACRELLAGLRRLPPAARFQVVAYNTYAETLVIDGRRDLLPAEPGVVEQAARAVGRLTPSGNTDHAAALRRGLLFRPDVLYFVTDADDLTAEQVASVTACNHGTVIHAVELTRRRGPRPDGPLARLARDNRGTYRRVSPAPE